MHEIRISADLVSIVLEAAQSEKLREITKVNVSFGQMIQIVPDIFRFAFMEAVKGTIEEHAELCIEIIPVRMQCRICGDEFNVKEKLFACSSCGSVDLEILTGKELFVKSIEGE